MGQLPTGSMTLIETEEDAEKLEVTNPENLAFVTQTTLSLDDTAKIIEILQRRFPSISVPKKEDICYATTNRQHAVKMIAEKADAILVLGAPNSSNSNRLVEVAKREGCTRSVLVERAHDIDWSKLAGINTLGITCLLYTSPSPRDAHESRMPSSA